MGSRAGKEEIMSDAINLSSLISRTPYAARAAILSMAFALGACDQGDAPAAEASPKAALASGPSKGVGPIQSIHLGELDAALADKGEKIFSGTCAACHKLDQRYVGPAIAGVTRRRTPEWIMNMILNPTGMTQGDSTARALLAEYMTQMSVSATEEDARAILEYFRKVDG